MGIPFARAGLVNFVGTGMDWDKFAFVGGEYFLRSSGGVVNGDVGGICGDLSGGRGGVLELKSGVLTRSGGFAGTGRGLIGGGAFEEAVTFANTDDERGGN